MAYNRVEAAVRRALTGHFSSSAYHLLNNVTLPTEDGTTQIDHILVSRFGICIVESKHYAGWIFGSSSAAPWTQVIFTGDATFKTVRPLGVMPLVELQSHVAGFVEKVMSENRLQFCVGRLECWRKAISKQTDVEHVEYLRRKFGDVA